MTSHKGLNDFCTSCDKVVCTKEEVDFCKSHRHEIILMLDKDVVAKQTTRTNKTTKETKTRKKVKGWIGEYYVESILVDDKPKFLCNIVKDNVLFLKDNIITNDEVIRPIEVKECGYMPYAYTSAEITSLTSEQISKEELLEDIKSKIDRYVSARELEKYLILGDLLLTYCQEWISTIHYPYFVGETESGKSSVLHLARWLAYRCMFGEDIPLADVYNFLGSDEEGAGAVAEDEAQELWANSEKMRAYKSSYSKGSIKARIVGVDSTNKHQVFYKTFCPKWFAGEKVPDDKGFRERLAIVHMTEGQPQSNIKRLTEEETLQLQLLRKRLLVWKIQNIGKGFERIDSGLKQRDQELWEDYLAVVHDTKYYEKCKSVAAYYIEQRHNAIKDSLEAKIFKFVTDKLNEKLEINAAGFWEYITNDNQDLSGSLDHETFYPDDYQKVTKNSLARILEDKFQAIKKIRHEKDDSKYHKKTFYAFDNEVIKKLTMKYGVNLG